MSGPPSAGALISAMWGPPSGGPLLAAQPATLQGRVVAAAGPGVPELPLRRARLTVIGGARAAAPLFSEALETLVPQAQRVTLGESESRTLDLRLQRIPR